MSPIHPSFIVYPHCYSQCFAFCHLLLGLLNNQLPPSIVSRYFIPHFSRSLNRPSYPTHDEKFGLCYSSSFVSSHYLCTEPETNPLVWHITQHQPDCLICLQYITALQNTHILCQTISLEIKFTCLTLITCLHIFAWEVLLSRMLFSLNSTQKLSTFPYHFTHEIFLILYLAICLFFNYHKCMYYYQ